MKNWDESRQMRCSEQQHPWPACTRVVDTNRKLSNQHEAICGIMWGLTQFSGKPGHSGAQQLKQKWKLKIWQLQRCSFHISSFHFCFAVVLRYVHACHWTKDRCWVILGSIHVKPGNCTDKLTFDAALQNSWFTPPWPGKQASLGVDNGEWTIGFLKRIILN